MDDLFCIVRMDLSLCLHESDDGAFCLEAIGPDLSNVCVWPKDCVDNLFAFFEALNPDRWQAMPFAQLQELTR